MGVKVVLRIAYTYQRFRCSLFQLEEVVHQIENENFVGASAAVTSNIPQTEARTTGLTLAKSVEEKSGKNPGKVSWIDVPENNFDPSTSNGAPLSSDLNGNVLTGQR